MKYINKLVITTSCILAFSTSSSLAQNNSAIDLTYKGVNILTDYPTSKARKAVGKLDEEKLALEQEITNELLSNSEVTSVSYVSLNGDQKIQFTGSNNGLVYVDISGIEIDSHGKGKKSLVKFDWDLTLSNLGMTGQYNLLTGSFDNIELSHGYSVNFDFDAHGIGGFFLDVIELFGFDARQQASRDFENLISHKLESMFNAKFNNYSTSFYALDDVVPATVMYQGRNVSQEIKNYIITPINGKSVTITTDLETSVNQNIKIDLWGDIVLTARRVKPVITSASYHYMGCQGYNRQGYLNWSDTNSNSTYTIQRSSAGIWNTNYQGANTTTGNSLGGGTYYYRVKSKRQGVEGEWKNFTANIPNCYGGGSVIIE